MFRLFAHFSSQESGRINNRCEFLKHRITKEIECIKICATQKNVDYQREWIIEERMRHDCTHLYLFPVRGWSMLLQR